MVLSSSSGVVTLDCATTNTPAQTTISAAILDLKCKLASNPIPPEMSASDARSIILLVSPGSYTVGDRARGFRGMKTAGRFPLRGQTGVGPRSDPLPGGWRRGPRGTGFSRAEGGADPADGVLLAETRRHPAVPGRRGAPGPRSPRGCQSRRRLPIRRRVPVTGVFRYAKWRGSCGMTRDTARLRRMLYRRHTHRASRPCDCQRLQQQDRLEAWHADFRPRAKAGISVCSLSSIRSRC